MSQIATTVEHSISSLLILLTVSSITCKFGGLGKLVLRPDYGATCSGLSLHNDFRGTSSVVLPRALASH